MISLGFSADGKRIRRKASGKTKAIVQDRLKKLHDELQTGVRASPNYTVRRAAQDWLMEGLAGRSAKTIKKNENVLEPILGAIGARRLRELTAGDVHQALAAMAQRYSSAAVAMGHNALTRVIGTPKRGISWDGMSPRWWILPRGRRGGRARVSLSSRRPRS